MGDDLESVELEWLIELARKGDGEQLADLIRRNEPLDPKLRAFVADVVAGKIRLRRPPKVTYLDRRRSRWNREKQLVEIVEFKMREAGKQRDLAMRARLTGEWCPDFGTTPKRVAEYIKSNRRRR